MSDRNTAEYYDIRGDDTSIEVTSHITPITNEEAEPELPISDFMGRAISKEYNGNKVIGKIINYSSTPKLFEVLFEDNRMEYLKMGEILSTMINKKDTQPSNMTKPITEVESGNSSKNTTESKEKCVAPIEESPPPSKMRRISSINKLEGCYLALAHGKTPTRKRTQRSSKKAQGGASSSRVFKGIASSNSGKAEVTPQHEKKNKAKSKPGPKSKKKTNVKSEQANATPTYHPKQFIGLFVCKEFDGVKSLGSVRKYCPKKKMLEIQFLVDGRTVYMKHTEALTIIAKENDILEAQAAARAENLKILEEEERLKKASEQSIVDKGKQNAVHEEDRLDAEPEAEAEAAERARAQKILEKGKQKVVYEEESAPSKRKRTSYTGIRIEERGSEGGHS